MPLREGSGRSPDNEHVVLGWAKWLGEKIPFDESNEGEFERVLSSVIKEVRSEAKHNLGVMTYALNQMRTIASSMQDEKKARRIARVISLMTSDPKHH